MMNLTGDGNGFDMITIPRAWRDQVPTANFFLKSGYRREHFILMKEIIAPSLAAAIGVGLPRLSPAVAAQR
jgi:hypothetical protein